ncbi:iron-containing alcohol dehydrogenase [Acetobacterium woodii]|uniref:Alcohol dehydrogenase, iron-type n=1 Tax=Acetobacterium woodii (strain ATCC 29683 / DSM 1030 / JCM 2381 / KCTC 1655 / WB1) TaxID=931626 RepID=H6LJ53_ACEWD|nr:iron-containing alcohol dehydrogenase [Acetobacterium woodii]AFA47416.1 alcohol dehydrogenase, iron-type [Acetobacterium woodii DSM 1030]
MQKALNTIKNVPYRTSQLVMKQAVQVLKIPIPPVLKGPGMVRRFPEIIKLSGVTKVLVVTDKPIYTMGLLDSFLCSLETNGIEAVVFDRVQPNPTFENIEDGLTMYYSANCNGVVAFGGGSPIDCAKIIAAKVTNRKSIEKMRGLLKLNHKLPPFFAIPTTSGTGSEASVCAVITDVKNHEKFSINDTRLVPMATVLDPELTTSLPPSLTATTGMDALTHAIEAYIGNYDTAFVKEKALTAAEIIINNLEPCYHNGQNLELRLKLAQASFDAGLAFTRAYVGNVHAIAHAMGGFYGVPHGLANAIVLPKILEFSRKAAEKKLAEMAFYCGLGEAMYDDESLSRLFIEKIKSMNSNMGIPTTIYALKASDIPELTKRILKEANPNYPVPRIMHYQECYDLLLQLCPETSHNN